MAVGSWIVDKSVAARVAAPGILDSLQSIGGKLCVCEVGELEQLFSARSAGDYDLLKASLHANFQVLTPPPDIFQRALDLQRDLAHYRGMWHRTAIPDLLIAETALYYGTGVVHIDRDYERIAQVRPLQTRALRA